MTSSLKSITLKANCKLVNPIMDRTISNEVNFNKRESYSLLNMSKTHWKDILLLDLTEEFQCSFSLFQYPIKKLFKYFK